VSKAKRTGDLSLGGAVVFIYTHPPPFGFEPVIKAYDIAIRRCATSEHRDSNRLKSILVNIRLRVWSIVGCFPL
jgi:hypothetical protein